MSTSDNSDPNANGRTYTIIDMELARHVEERSRAADENSSVRPTTLSPQVR
jgi:hypothetical protein